MATSDRTIKTHENQWAIVIVEDRYGGIYSGGKWLAFKAGSTEPWSRDSHMKVVFEEEISPYGSDAGASEFWENPPAWIAIGDTPNEAFENLIK